MWGSGIAGTLCAALSLIYPQHTDILRLAFVASYGSKLSDTVSSEIGKAYGKRTYLVTSFKPVPRGTEGAVSLEGTLAGAGAAGIFAGLAVALKQV